MWAGVWIELNQTPTHSISWRDITGRFLIYIYIYINYLALLKITTESFLFFWGSDLYSASKKTNREPPWGAAPLLLPLVNVTASLMMERISCQPPTHTHTHTLHPSFTLCFVLSPRGPCEPRCVFGHGNFGQTEDLEVSFLRHRSVSWCFCRSCCSLWIILWWSLLCIYI